MVYNTDVLFGNVYCANALRMGSLSLSLSFFQFAHVCLLPQQT